MDSLDPLAVFTAVAEAGGFTAAADRLGMTKSAVSLRVRQLEAQLGVDLFVRTTRRVQLTQAGQQLFDAAAAPLRTVREALAGAASSRQLLTGHLRITAPVEQAAMSLAAPLARFSAAHPGLRIELFAADRVLDLVAGGIDVAIRLGHLRDSSERATKLAEFEQWVVASPAYLRAKPAPRRPADLAEHDWIHLTLLRSPLTWTFASARGKKESVRVRSRLQVDSTSTLRALLEQGAGVSVLDHPSVLPLVREGKLVRLLPSWSLPKGGIHAVYPPGRHVSGAARAFVESYREHLQAALA
ncbi:LysR family transcriptional regulator [Ramlibacter sp. G-1-2-2]|uniref:LysR family transcriptional regulator n=1 Tax=Ramlibacter agri TaxID=2728837 RepID=A0A848HE07_9BURK|nr:LysR family transcriptional regulator [Ramlibacter agri]NML47591.1 LysR family transcriptional regulator [Ramlibacter agri]